MSKYSKIFFGQKKYHEIKPFRFPIYNDLVAGEIEGIEETAKKQANNTYSMLKIAMSASASSASWTGMSCLVATDLAIFNIE